MPLSEPGWWYPVTAGAVTPWQAWALSPLSLAYRLISDRRLAHPPEHHATRPVICIGNFTAGGTGKTPLALRLTELLEAEGLAPVVLSRGYNGTLRGPVWVDGAQHTATAVGDEPLMMARHVPVMVAKHRPDGARAIAQADGKADVIILDDGLQNPSLKKDLSIAVIDGARGVGNGWVIPSGPLRASLATQLAHTDAIVINGGSAGANATERCGALRDRLRALGFRGPIMVARVNAAEKTDWLRNTRVLAYAGIGNPGRFFDTLESVGAEVVAKRVFPDHAPLSDADADELVQAAHSQNLQLVTTEKDFARLGGGRAAARALREASRPLSVRLEFDEDQKSELTTLIHKAIADWQARSA